MRKAGVVMGRAFVILIVLSCLCFAPSVAFATSADTGFFTDLKYSPHSGDVGGYELYIAYSRKGFTAVLLDCQGECSPLEKVEPVFEGNQITFEHTDLEGTKYTFKEEVDESGIRGSFYHPEYGAIEDVFLKRSQPYWNR